MHRGLTGTVGVAPTSDLQAVSTANVGGPERLILQQLTALLKGRCSQLSRPLA
jgi:hypothetical protein